jgi:simple sugar transport system substrate-binding protein
MGWLNRTRSVFQFGILFLVLFILATVGAAKEDIVLGFVQVSSEGTWRMTNSISVKESAEKEGIHLLFREGRNNYSNQIEEIRELIATGVDVLAFSPSQEDGWDDVLGEAKDAGVPVIVLDRAINVADESLYVAHIGSDMIEEGRRAARWLLNYMQEQDKGRDEIRIAVLEGVKGSTPALHRDKGFREVLTAQPNYKIVRSEPANYIFSKGKEVMARFLADEADGIDVVFAHNDEMALGAVEAVREYGKNPGEDIVIIGVDAIRKAFEAMIKGDMNCSIECSPLLGPQLMQAVKDIMSGKEIPREVITIEHDYDQKNAAQELTNRTY